MIIEIWNILPTTKTCLVIIQGRGLLTVTPKGQGNLHYSYNINEINTARLATLYVDCNLFILEFLPWIDRVVGKSSTTIDIRHQYEYHLLLFHR